MYFYLNIRSVQQTSQARIEVQMQIRKEYRNKKTQT